MVAKKAFCLFFFALVVASSVAVQLDQSFLQQVHANWQNNNPSSLGLEAFSQFEIVRDVKRPILPGRVLSLQQKTNGLVVKGAVLKVIVDQDGKVESVHGKVHQIATSQSPAVDLAKASSIAFSHLQNNPSDYVKSLVFKVKKSELIYFPSVDKNGQVHLAWSIILISESKKVAAYEYIVDAHHGKVLAALNQRKSTLTRQIYGIDGEVSFLMWQEGATYPSGDPRIDDFLSVTEEVYDSMTLYHLDSFDNNGAAFVGYMYQCDDINMDFLTTPEPHVEYCAEIPSVVSDLVAHEWGHAYLYGQGNFIDYGESGAIEEHYADVFSQANAIAYNHHAGVTRSNSTCFLTGGNVRWIVAPQLQFFSGSFGLRDFWSPNCFYQPGFNGDNYQQCFASGTVPEDSNDGLGTHANMGIPNHLFALVVDSSNGGGIGIDKAFGIWWNTMVERNTPSVDFVEFASNLQSTCQSLVGSTIPGLNTDANTTLTSGDCSALNAAISQVNMNQPFACSSSDAAEPFSIVAMVPPAGPYGSWNTTVTFYSELGTSSGVACRETDKSTSSTSTILGVGADGELYNSLVCEVPQVNSARTIAVSVSDNSQTTFSSAYNFQYYAPPTISGVSPTSGSATGFEITITGSNFAQFSGCSVLQTTVDVNGNNYDCLVCLFGQVNADGTTNDNPVLANYVNSTQLTCQVPSKEFVHEVANDEHLVWVSLNNLIFHGGQFSVHHDDSGTPAPGASASPTPFHSLSAASSVSVSMVVVAVAFLAVVFF